MMLPQLLALSLAVAPNLVNAALFPESTLVKWLDHKGFKQAMKENLTSVVAFVAPWCGHCQRMAPEYSKAALGLYPLVPLYAVDCDAPKNKKLCADQGVKGFPTVKLFPRGRDQPPVEFQGPDRTASAFYYWASRGIPHKNKKIAYFEDIPKVINAEGVVKKPRALLMNKSNKMPLLWTTLANKYKDQITFFSHRDRKGKDSVKMGFEAGESGSPKVLIYPAGETKPGMYKGIMKFDSLSKFFDSLVDGTVDLDQLNAAAEAEEFVPDEKELEIERQQEAEMLKLAHGGFADMIDFEKAVKDGSAKNFHAQNGYPGMMGAPPDSKYVKKNEPEAPGGSAGGVHDSSAQQEVPHHSGKGGMPMTEDANQVVMETPTDTATEEIVTETPSSEHEASTPEPEVMEEGAPAADTVVVEEDEAPAPEPPAEPDTETERIKDEL